MLHASCSILHCPRRCDACNGICVCLFLVCSVVLACFTLLMLSSLLALAPGDLLLVSPSSRCSHRRLCVYIVQPSRLAACRLACAQCRAWHETPRAAFAKQKKLDSLCAQLIVVRHLTQNFADIQEQDCCTATELADFLPCRDGAAGRTYPVMLMRMWDAPERAGPPNDRRKLHSELGSSTGPARMFGQIPRLEHPKSLHCIGSLNITLAEICSKWRTRMCPMISGDSSTWITAGSITVGHMRRPCRIDACAILKMADSRIVPPWTTQQKTWADEWIRGCCQLAIRTPLGSVSNAFARRLQNMLRGLLGFSTLLAFAIMMRFAGLCRAQSTLQHFTAQRCVDCKTYRAPLHVGPAHGSEPQLCCHSRHSFADLTLRKSLPGPKSGGRTPLADENSSTCRGPVDTRVGTFAQTSREPHSVNSHDKPLLAKPGAWLDETRCMQQIFKLRSRRGLFGCNCVLRLWFCWLFVFAFNLRVTAAADDARTRNALLVRDFAVKRAFRRARNRAREHGGTWYRGQWCTASMLERTHGSAAPQTRQATRTGHKHARTRLRVLTLNVGVLSTDAYDELMTTLATQRRWDVVMLQETGWKMEKMYSAAEWHVVCSGQKDDKNSGVITMIARRLCDAEHLRFQTPKPGHILHVQIAQSFQTFDVVNVYQFAWNHTVPVEVMISKRDQVWQKLGGLLAQLPKRNILVLAGDFNTSASSMPRLVGRGIAGPDTVVPDQGAFVALLETHSLVALNTWGKSRHCHTFTLNERVKSQIDFVLTRCRAADSLARCASVCNTLCLFAWRGGGRHLPVKASLPAKLYLPPRRESPSCDVAALLKARDADTEQFRRMRLSVVDAFHRNQPDAQGLNNILLQAGVEHFPTRASSRPRPWQTDTVQVTLKAMWAFRARAKLEVASYRRTGAFVHMFQAWKMTRFVSMHRDFRRQGRISRKELWLTKLKEAEQAAAQGNSRTLFAVVRDLAPRRDPRPVQLRGSQGELLSPAKELQLLKDFCCDLFDFPATQNAPAPKPASITLDADEVLRSLLSLKVRRANPKHLAPAALWRPR